MPILCGRSMVQRLLDALGTKFDEVRQGVLLSRLRSLDAIREAYDSEEGKGELYPDAIAAIADTIDTLRDLLATLPNVRRIEAERVALGIQSSANALEAAQRLNIEFNAAVCDSDAVTPAAVKAVQVNDADIREARAIDVRAKLLADAWLVSGTLRVPQSMCCSTGGISRISPDRTSRLGCETWPEPHRSQVWLFCLLESIGRLEGVRGSRSKDSSM